jgi:class 3 adenylate cyclase/CHASE2 domain-containing sensor protein
MKLPGKLVVMGLGVLTTLLTALLWLSGAGRQLELWCLDWAFRQAPPTAIRDDLLHVDIDDLSIEQLGRWPWPREKHAGLIDTLKAAGAKSIAFDVEFLSPQEVRFVSEVQSLFAASGENDFRPQPIIDDAELSHSLEKAGNVTLAMHMDFTQASLLPFEGDIEAELRGNPKMSLWQCGNRITGLDFKLPISDETRETFEKAYLRVRSRIDLEKHVRGSLTASQGHSVMPLVTLAQHAGDIGFVNAELDDDGMVRRARLLGNEGERTYAQFALSLALQTLQKQHSQALELRTNGTQLLVFAGTELLRQIEFDQGGMLINWSLGTGQKDGNKHRRIGARAVADVWLEKQRLQKLEKIQYGFKTAWISLGKQITDPNTDELYWSFMDETERLDALYAERIRLERAEYWNRLYDPAEPSLASKIQEIQDEEQQCEKQLFQLTDRLFAALAEDRDSFLGKPQTLPDEGVSEEVTDYRQRAQEADKIQDALVQNFQIRTELEENIVKLQDELAGVVAGKICLIGSTATAAADFVPTPMGKNTPGINVHASIYDTIVSGELIRPAGFALNLAAILMAGLVVSMLSLRFNTAVGGAIVMGLAIMYSLLNARVVLPRWNLHLAMAFPVGTMLCVFVVLTVYKEITEGRQKAFIKQAFKHYLSSHVIEQILHDPQALQLGGEKRELTIMFTDLAGFSSFSERLGPVELTALLNDYLTEMTDIIMEEGGTLDKYEGDAIIAFWNAPLTQSDHAVCACRAVLRCQRRLEELRQTYVEQTGAELRMRVGLNTGEVVVGNMGSTQRFNYTILGDAANLAARLEGANKAFGTETMISENTWRLAASEFQGRKLADLRVVGRKTPMTVYEMTGLSSESAPPEWAHFSAGLEQFRAGDFASAVETFSRLPGDPAARHYVQQCEALVAQPPKDWDGIWELTSK